MRVWRLTRALYVSEPLAGHGAARSGNRWNSVGVRVAYTASSRPLAVLEMLVHVTRDTIPADPVLIPVEIPDGLAARASELPADWNRLPYSAAAQRVGDEWVAEQRSLALLVPSVVLPGENNVLINPLHPEFAQVEVFPPETFSFDRRLLR